MRIAVLGSSGFVGSHTVSALRARGHSPAPIPTPRLTSRRQGDEAITYIAQRLMSLQCDAVINAAGIPDSTSDSAQLELANGFLPGLAAVAAKAANCRLVHVSSAAVQGRRYVLDSSREWDATSPYAASKVRGEQAVLHQGTRCVIYRPPGVHGPGRAVTQQVARLAQSPLAIVAAPGTRNSPQALVQNVADAIAFLATTDISTPGIVHHPSEGLTTATLMRYLGGKEPLTIPRSTAHVVVQTSMYAARLHASLVGHSRRLEVLLLGQAQDTSWLTTAGWTPPLGLDAWNGIREKLA